MTSNNSQNSQEGASPSQLTSILESPIYQTNRYGRYFFHAHHISIIGSRISQHVINWMLLEFGVQIIQCGFINRVFHTSRSFAHIIGQQQEKNVNLPPDTNKDKYICQPADKLWSISINTLNDPPKNVPGWAWKTICSAIISICTLIYDDLPSLYESTGT